MKITIPPCEACDRVRGANTRRGQIHVTFDRLVRLFGLPAVVTAERQSVARFYVRWPSVGGRQVIIAKGRPDERQFCEPLFASLNSAATAGQSFLDCEVWEVSGNNRDCLLLLELLIRPPAWALGKHTIEPAE